MDGGCSRLSVGAARQVARHLGLTQLPESPRRGHWVLERSLGDRRIELVIQASGDIWIEAMLA